MEEPQSSSAANFERQMQSVMDTKCSNLLGSGASAMAPSKTSFRSIHTNVCANARANVVAKQLGGDPNLPGPGQYINPLREGRNSDGEAKSFISKYKNFPSVKFAGSSTRYKAQSRSMAKPGSEKEPGPGQYIDPLKYGRDEYGVSKPVLSSEKGFRSTTWCKKGASRGIFNGGAMDNPGPVRPFLLLLSVPLGAFAHVLPCYHHCPGAIFEPDDAGSER